MVRRLEIVSEGLESQVQTSLVEHLLKVPRLKDERMTSHILEVAAAKHTKVLGAEWEYSCTPTALKPTSPT